MFENSELLPESAVRESRRAGRREIDARQRAAGDIAIERAVIVDGIAGDDGGIGAALADDIPGCNAIQLLPEGVVAEIRRRIQRAGVGNAGEVEMLW